MRPRLPAAEIAARDVQIQRLLREGVTADVVARAVDVHVGRVERIRRELGIKSARATGARKGTTKETSPLKQALAECDRFLGRAFVRRLLGAEPDLESADLIRLHAAVRCAAVDGEDMLRVVHRRLALLRAAKLDALATRGLGEAGL